jgi:hypothetical protein
MRFAAIRKLLISAGGTTVGVITPSLQTGTVNAGKDSVNRTAPRMPRGGKSVSMSRKKR